MFKVMIALPESGHKKEAQADLSFSEAKQDTDGRLFFIYGNVSKYKNPTDPYTEIVWDKDPVIACRIEPTWKTQAKPSDFESVNVGFTRLPHTYAVINKAGQLLLQGEENVVGLSVNILPGTETVLMKKNQPVCIFRVDK